MKNENKDKKPWELRGSREWNQGVGHDVFKGVLCRQGGFIVVVYDSEEQKNVRIGKYNDAEVAARVYDRERVLRGRKPVNFPEEDNSKYEVLEGAESARDASSGYKFVYKTVTGYQVTVRAKGKQHYVGMFEELDDAIVARNKAIKRLRKEYGREAVNA